jgi:hypothetical protein
LVEADEPGTDFAGVVLALPGVGAAERVAEDGFGSSRFECCGEALPVFGVAEGVSAAS